ncbi:MAG: hypothetical protein VB016_04385 [Methanomassiliicoccaceae archaeon]|nr:hypothetical protein [Methanomassiliicoccaceae archaeon]
MLDQLISDLSCVTGYLAVALLVIGIAILAYGIFSGTILSLEVAIPALVLLTAGVLVTFIATGYIVLEWWPLGLSNGAA